MAHHIGVVIGSRFAKDATVYAKFSDEHSIDLVLRMLEWSLHSRAFV